LGAAYKARNPGVRWVAELSDPFTIRTDGTRREYDLPANDIMASIRTAARAANRTDFQGGGVFEAIEWMAYALADELIFTNELQRDFMLDGCVDAALAERARSVSRVVQHPQPPHDHYTRAKASRFLSSDKVNVAYFGRFYGVRGVVDLLDPFAQLSATERAKISFTIFTPDVDDAREAAQAHPAADCVEVREALPYFEFLATARAADWLLVADARTSGVLPVNPYLPSKLADYQGSGTRIWGLVEPGSAMSAIQLDASSELGNVRTAAQVLREKVLPGTSRH
jgi:hypothetical protein